MSKNDTVKLSVDFIPDIPAEKWKCFAERRVNQYTGCSVYSCLLGTVHKKLTALFIKSHGLKMDTPVTAKNSEQIVRLFMDMKNLTVTPERLNPFENAQVCAGGVDFSEVDENLQSVLQKNLYFCGEILNVDGKCGGYNLQWAWTSGYLAGKDAGKA